MVKSCAAAITNAAAPAIVSGTYLFNGFNQRVQKVTGGVTTQFVYDTAGHLIEEADGSGTTKKQYIWLDDLPVAMVDSTGVAPVLYFIHADQIGSPQKITNGALSVSWDGVFDAFGNPTTGASLSLTNLRFPGQYFDAEAGLSQNWFRDYNPAIGRYIQSDRIGLASGTNTYSYVHSNPFKAIDPYGLWQVTISGGAEGGGILTFGRNAGQWNIGLWAGAGVGLAWDIDLVDSGICERPGFKNSWRMIGAWNLGKFVGLGVDLTLAKSGAGFSGSVATPIPAVNVGVNVNAPINGKATGNFGTTLGGSKNPVTGGAAATIGYGFTYFSGR